MKKPISYYIILICELIITIIILSLIFCFIALILFAPAHSNESNTNSSILFIDKLLGSKKNFSEILQAILKIVGKLIFTISIIISLKNKKIIPLKILSIIQFLYSIIVSFDLVLSLLVVITSLFSKKLKQYCIFDTISKTSNK